MCVVGGRQLKKKRFPGDFRSESEHLGLYIYYRIINTHAMLEVLEWTVVHYQVPLVRTIHTLRDPCFCSFQ